MESTGCYHCDTYSWRSAMVAQGKPKAHYSGEETSSDVTEPWRCPAQGVGCIFGNVSECLVMTVTNPGARESPIFLVGSVRSGTTMLRLMMEHHPQIALLFESEFMFDRIGPRGEFPSEGAYRDYLDSHRVFGLSQLERKESVSFSDQIRDFIEQHRQRCHKPIVGATVHHAFDRIRFIYPRAKYVYLHRDGRDVATSIVRLRWAGNYWSAAQTWLKAEQTWERLKPSLSSTQWIEVSYESLITDPCAELTRICEFANCDYSPTMLEYDASSNYQPPDASLVYRWRDQLKPSQIRLMESLIGDALVHRGYSLSGLPTYDPGWFESQWLSFQNWWGRAQARMRTYGLPLFTADFVARRVGTQPWRQRLKQRINEIDNAHLQ